MHQALYLSDAPNCSEYSIPFVVFIISKRNATGAINHTGDHTWRLEAAALTGIAMATERRFEGRAAVITGAGRGLGRDYALLLASKGARVVGDDLGGSISEGLVESTLWRSITIENALRGMTGLPDRPLQNALCVRSALRPR